MFWKQLIFRGIGITCVGGGLFAFYDYGTDLLPIFTRFVAGDIDSFEIFTVFSSFFLGAFSLTWVGTQLMALRSFSRTWLYCAVLPVVPWLQMLYDIDRIVNMDKALSLGVVYFFLYVFILKLVFFVHTHWFTPVSHEDGRRVSLEKPSTSFFSEYKWAILIFMVLVYVTFNPSNSVRMLDATLSTVSSALHWLSQ